MKGVPGAEPAMHRCFSFIRLSFREVAKGDMTILDSIQLCGRERCEVHMLSVIIDPRRPTGCHSCRCSDRHSTHNIISGRLYAAIG